MSSLFDTSNRRNYFRLRFPTRERPTFITDSGEYAVTEISERGFRFETIRWPASVHELSGTIRLANGRLLQVAGRVGRIDRREVIVVKLQGVKLGDVFDEQRRLMQKYPMLPF